MKGPSSPVKRVQVEAGGITWAGPVDGLHYLARYVQDGDTVDIFFEPLGGLRETVEAGKEFKDPFKVTVYYFDGYAETVLR